jgi:hypothetical protein
MPTLPIGLAVIHRPPALIRARLVLAVLWNIGSLTAAGITGPTLEAVAGGCRNRPMPLPGHRPAAPTR